MMMFQLHSFLAHSDHFCVDLYWSACTVHTLYQYSLVTHGDTFDRRDPW